MKIRLDLQYDAFLLLNDSSGTGSLVVYNNHIKPGWYHWRLRGRTLAYGTNLTRFKIERHRAKRSNVPFW